MVNVTSATSVIWTEKYRPKRFEDIFDQEIVLDRLRSYAKNNNLPNLVFYGQSGTGKTSMAYIISRELYGEFWAENLTHFDASDFFERGKEYIRSEIRFKRFFDEYKSVIGIFKDLIGEYSSLLPINADFKIIFFTNSESLPLEAQHALRRIMERHNRTSRFIFETSRPSNLIAPIRSRCQSYHFKRISEESISQLIRKIAKEEGIIINGDGLKSVVYVSDGDAKKAINTLQAASIVNSEIDSQIVFEVVKEMKSEDINELVKQAFNGNFTDVRDAIDNLLINKGFLGGEIISQVRKAILNIGLPDYKLAQLLVYVSDADSKIRCGLNDRIHLEEMFFKFGDTVI